MACLRVWVFARRCSSPASSASISVRTSAMAVCSALVGGVAISSLRIFETDNPGWAEDSEYWLRFILPNTDVSHRISVSVEAVTTIACSDAKNCPSTPKTFPHSAP